MATLKVVLSWVKLDSSFKENDVCLLELIEVLFIFKD